MTRAAVTTTPTDMSEVFDGRVRRLKWTCRFTDCGRHFETYTRRGLWLTCPHCKRGQEGPAGIQRLLDKNKPRKAPTVTPIRIVEPPPPAKPAPAKPAAAAKAKAQTTAAPPMPPPSSPAQPSRGLGDAIGRALGFGS